MIDCIQVKHAPTKFEYHDPNSLDQACQMLAELKIQAKLIAGGTDILVNMKKRLLHPAHLVSLGKLEELSGIRANREIRIGACVSAARLADSDALKQHCAALSQGAGLLGSPLIRNRATIGGNLANARPSADLPPRLMVLGATAHLKSANAQRSLAVAELFSGPGQTVLRDDEILTHLSIPKAMGGSGSAFIKLGVRKTLEISLVSAAAYIQLGRDGAIEQARIALASVAPTPVMEDEAARMLLGEKPEEKLFARAGEIAGSVCRPIDDFRGSAGDELEFINPSFGG